MGHSFYIENSYLLKNHLNEQDIKDIIDTFYVGDDTHFSVIINTNKGPRGLHQYNSLAKSHTISLSSTEIESSVSRGKRCGGSKSAPNFKMGVAMVLSHEIQHANQRCMEEKSSTAFYGKKRSRYMSRPCEMEARQFVDNNMKIISEIMGYDTGKNMRVEEDDTDVELDCVVDTFSDSVEVSVREIAEELRQSEINNPSNVEYVKKKLRQLGIEITR